MMQPSAEQSDFERAIERFELAWQRGLRPQIGDFLAEHVHSNVALRERLLIELVKIDIEYQWRKPHEGIPCDIEGYLRQFPQLGQDSAVLADLAREEYRVRHRFGDRPCAAEYYAKWSPRLGSMMLDCGQVEQEVQLEAARLASRPVHDDELNVAHRQSLDGIPVVSYRDLTIERFLGSGGMGKVYRAVDRRGGQKVAVKMLKKSRQRNREAVARFMDEARLASSLKHSGIVPIEGWGRTPQGGLFLVLEWIDGPDLSRLAMRERVSLRQALAWTLQAAEAIQYAHEQGVVHCDLKPANLLVRSDGQVLVSDFGLARLLDAELDGHPRLEGTASYMAPEQIDSNYGVVGPRTDVYGLGAVLFTLLTQQPPYHGETVLDIVAQVLSAATPHPVSASMAIPDCVIEICEQCLAKNPGDRFDSAQALGDALRLHCR